MKRWELIVRATSPANAAITLDAATEAFETVTVWGIQSAGGAATVSLGFMDEAGNFHAIYRNAAALAAAEPGTLVGNFARGDAAFVAANAEFGPPPARLRITATAAGVGLTTTFEVWGYRDVEPDAPSPG